MLRVYLDKKYYKTHHRGIFHTAIHLHPLDIIGRDELSSCDIAPFPVGESWIMESVCGRWVVEEILDGGLCQ